MKITPLNGCILLRVDEENTKTDSGLLLATGSVRLPQTGTIESIAKDVKGLKVGDRVMFLRYAAIDGIDADTRICKQEHIVGKIDE